MNSEQDGSDIRFCDQQSNDYDARPNGTSNTQQDAMELSEVYYLASLEEEYYPVEEERRQAEGRSVVHFSEMEQQPPELVYKVVRVLPEHATTRSNSGNRLNLTSVKKISSERTPEDRTTEL